MNTRRQFITTVAGVAAVSSKASAAEPKPEFYQLSPTGKAFNKDFEMMTNITTNKR